MKQTVTMSNDVTCNVVNSKNERFKIYNHKTPYSSKENVVYLENNQEFKIELKNNLQERIAAKIFINNKDIGNMLIIRPGERIYLERFLDDNKKFLFETYTVDGDRKTIESTESNGEVKIEYYKEQHSTIYITRSNTWTTLNEPYYGNNNVYYSNTTGGCSSSNDVKHLSSNVSNINCTLDMCSMDLNKSKDFETGRIEKGSVSEQEFRNVDFEPQYYPFETSTLRLMAKSNKPTYVENIKTYCVNCGSRRRKNSHKFCSNCGTKF